MKIRLSVMFSALIGILLAGCAAGQTPAPATATITVLFDLSGGGSGFSATEYVQEVTSGKTYSLPYSSGAHGGVILPTSAPSVFQVEAPGTYVIYANLVNAPEAYHFGVTGCPAGSDCTSTVLKAIDVVASGSYNIYLSDRPGERHAPVPTPHAPVTVPWQH